MLKLARILAVLVVVGAAAACGGEEEPEGAV